MFNAEGARAIVRASFCACNARRFECLTLDMAVTNGLSFIINFVRGKSNGRILRKVQGQKGNKGCQGYNHEERQTGDPGRLPELRNKDVQNWQELRQL
jgi:hypothetical protein